MARKQLWTAKEQHTGHTGARLVTSRAAQGCWPWQAMRQGGAGGSYPAWVGLVELIPDAPQLLCDPRLRAQVHGEGLGLPQGGCTEQTDKGHRAACCSVLGSIPHVHAPTQHPTLEEGGVISSQGGRPGPMKFRAMLASESLAPASRTRMCECTHGRHQTHT